MKKLIAMLLCIVMICGVFAGCGKQKEAPETEEPAKTEEKVEKKDENKTEDINETGALKLLWTQSKGVGTLFESPMHDSQTLYPYMIFDSLISIDGVDGSVVHKLATDHTISEDGLTYTFTIRDDAKWHDGEPLTVDDVLFSLYAGIADADAWATWDTMNKIEGADAVASGESKTFSGVSVDGNTIQIKLKEPYGFFMKDLAALYILPKHLFEGVAPEELETCSFWEKPIGSGAYKMDEVVFPDYFTLVRNDDYWGEKAGIKNVMFTNYSTGGTDAITAAMIAGEVDMAYGNELNDINLAENVKAQNDDIEYFLSNQNYQRFFVFNEVGGTDGKGQNGIKDARVRRAISMLIDRPTIAAFYNGQAVPLTTFVTESSSMYNDDIPTFERDVEGAKKLLEEANFDFSKKVRIAYYYNDQTTIDIMDLICQNLKEAGIEAEATLVSGDVGAALWDARNYEFMYKGWGRNDLVQFYSCLSGGQMDPIFENKEYREEHFGKKVAAYNSAMDQDVAKQIADEMQADEIEQCYAMPIYNLKMVTLVNTNHLSVPETALGDSCYPNSRNYSFSEWSLSE